MFLNFKRKAAGHHPCVAAAVVGGVTSLASGYMASQASKNAANTQANAANNATQLQQNIYNQNQANLNPYMTQGKTALNTLNTDLANGILGGSFTGQDYLNNKDPGYEFQLQQGQQALQNSQAAQDGIMSGSALKGLSTFNQGLASTGYQNAYNRWLATQNNTYNQLSSLAGLGENAAAGAGNTGAAIGNGMANTITGAGNAQAAGQIGQANAISNGLSNLAGYYAIGNMSPSSGINPGIGGLGSNSSAFTNLLMGGEF